MRSLVGLYLSIGLVLLVVGFFATGPCPNKNQDVVSDAVFVLGWPVFLYDDVASGHAAAQPSSEMNPRLFMVPPSEDQA